MKVHSYVQVKLLFLFLTTCTLLPPVAPWLLCSLLQCVHSSQMWHLFTCAILSAVRIKTPDKLATELQCYISELAFQTEFHSALPKWWNQHPKQKLVYWCQSPVKISDVDRSSPCHLSASRVTGFPSLGIALQWPLKGWRLVRCKREGCISCEPMVVSKVQGVQ